MMVLTNLFCKNSQEAWEVFIASKTVKFALTFYKDNKLRDHGMLLH